MQMPDDIFQSVTVRRYPVGSYDANGRWTEASGPTVVSIFASVQSPSARELLRLEEGDRAKDSIAVYTQDPLYTLDEVTGRRADQVNWDGEYWQVMKVGHYHKTPELTHYWAIAVREQKQ